MRSLLSLAVVLIVLTGCSTTHSAQPPTPEHRSPPISLRWGIAGLPDVPTLDPALASDSTSISLTSLLYGGLVRLDGKLHVQPDGARRWTISRNGRVYTFFLRHNLRFASGRIVTARDVVAALRRALGPEGSAGTAPFYLALIAHPSPSHPVPAIAALDRHTVRITLVHPAAHFLAELAFPASFVPDPTLIARYGPTWTDHAAGFGPFSVAVWRHGRFLRLQRNPYYYGGKATPKEIIFQFYQQEQGAVGAYRQGKLDIVSGLQAGETFPSSLLGVRRVPALALDYLAFNTTRLPFYRLNARRALAAVSTAVLHSEGPSSGAVAPHGFLPAAFGISSPTWHPDHSAAYYLAHARYAHGAHFPHLALVILENSGMTPLANSLTDAWRRDLGIDITVRQLNASDYGKVLNARAYDLAVVRWGADYPDPQDFLGTQLGTTDNNVTGWTGKAYERAVLTADSYAPTDPRRTTLFREAAALALAKVPLLPLDEPALAAIIRPGLLGIDLTSIGTITGDWTHIRIAA